MPLLRPDRYYVSVLDIDPSELKNDGVEALILDLDNTILPRTVREVPENLAAWVESLKESGLTFVFFSNNWHDRVVAAAKSLDVPFYGRAVKPFPFGFIRIRRELGVSRKKTIAIGDQVYTDILGAHLSGMRAYLVQPLTKQDLRHTRMLRHIEGFVLRNLEPVGGEPAFQADENDEALL